MGMDLAQLIAAAKGERSYDDLARAAGAVIGRQRWQQLATQKLKRFPDPDTIAAIARGLVVSPTEVVLASARSLGIRVADAGSSLSIETVGLSPDQIDAVRHVVQVMRGPEKGTGEVREPTSITVHGVNNPDGTKDLSVTRSRKTPPVSPGT